jgi:hypothetical protein
MKKKKESEKAEKSKKKERAQQLPPKQETNKWQEFLRRHSKVEEKKE